MPGYRPEVPIIPETVPQRPRCSVCKDKALAPMIDAMLTRGLSGAYISRELIAKGWNVSPERVNSHAKHFQELPLAKVTQKQDLAILVRDRAVEAINEGRLEPTISHGLAAQKMLDDRAARTKNADLMMAMARLLSGSGPAGYLGPPDDLIIDGEATVIE
jgi:malate synthase